MKSLSSRSLYHEFTVLIHVSKNHTQNVAKTKDTYNRFVLKDEIHQTNIRTIGCYCCQPYNADEELISCINLPYNEDEWKAE